MEGVERGRAERVRCYNRYEIRLFTFIPFFAANSLPQKKGEITHADSAPTQPLSFFPSAIVSLGAPKSWLLNSLRERGSEQGPLEGDPALYVADIGISNVVWKRLGGNRRSKGIDFGGEWVLGLRWQAGGAGAGGD